MNDEVISQDVKFLSMQHVTSNLPRELHPSHRSSNMFAFRLSVLLPSFLLLVTTVNALHFYLDANEKRCFVEELPSDTVVEGKYPRQWSRAPRMSYHTS
jgi:hypothetical protein